MQRLVVKILEKAQAGCRSPFNSSLNGQAKNICNRNTKRRCSSMPLLGRFEDAGDDAINVPLRQ
jgi:hypothetical protein